MALSLNKPKLDNLTNEIWKSAAWSACCHA